MGPAIVLGIFLILLGISNMRGNISSIHWYHRRRLTEENKMAFGRIVGLGTVICGAALIVFSGFSLAAEALESDLYTLIGSVIMIIALIAGLGMSLYAMLRYNRGIF